MRIYGLPGMWQNWLTSTCFQSDFEMRMDCTNFHVLSQREKLNFKLDQFTLLQTDDNVLNLYVESEHLPWYFCNFFEKTDEVGIKIKTIHTDIFKKAPGTQAFSEFLDHIIDTYELTSDAPFETVNNALIEAFYHFFKDSVEGNYWKTIITYKHNSKNCVNIEITDFGNPDVLYEKITTMLKLSRKHFDYMYGLLARNNTRFFNLKRDFYSRLKEKKFDDMNVIELGYLGVLADNGGEMDMFNPEFRRTLFEDFVPSV